MAEATALDEEVGSDSDDWATVIVIPLLIECIPQDVYKGQFIPMMWSKLLPLVGKVASFLGVTHSFIHKPSALL